MASKEWDSQKLQNKNFLREIFAKKQGPSKSMSEECAHPPTITQMAKENLKLNILNPIQNIIIFV